MQRTKTGDLKMSKVLAYAAPLAKDLFRGRANSGDFCVETKVSVNARGQIEKSLMQWTIGSK
jgi:hypothetical protein